MLVVDVRECSAPTAEQPNGKNVEFLPENGGADDRAFLKVGTKWSYDFEIRLPFKPGETPKALRVERKRFGDFVGSFLEEGKLERQTSYTDILVVEFDPEDVAATQARYAGDPRDPVGRAMKRLARMTANEGEFENLWVVPTLGPRGTLEALRYIERGQATRPKDVKKVRPAP